VIAKVPGGVTDGFVVSAGWQDIEGRLDEPAVAEWVERYRAATGSDDLPGTGALLGRMGAETFVRALEAAGRDLTHESFREAMYTLDYYDEIGGLQVDYGPDDHQGGDTIYVSRIVDGTWEMIGEVPPATN
ncbi:MAG TPA: ABC transporter substrate-binding protein, partial [Paracoccaceae bacterium]|nr:ABC transporter substrate-binding protein [Paracoccaceae bacterium]